MTAIFSKPKQDSTCRTGLEVYRTDETNFKPYISSGVVQQSSTSSSEEGSEKVGFSYHQGNILDTYFYANMESTNHEYDYSDMSDNASIKVGEVNKNRYYKGVRVSLKKEWQAPGKTLDWTDLKPVINGFITEQTFSETGVEIKVDGYSKLLDQKFVFDFKDMKRSKILEELIKTAGLVPVINVKGLDDDVTSFTTKSSSGSNSEASGIGSEEIDSQVKKIIGSETNDLKKAKLIHSWLIKNISYKGYSCSRQSSPEKCLSYKKLNCADTSRLTCAMMKSAGLSATVVHGPNHFWTVMNIDGKEYASDATSSSRGFNEVWHGLNYYAKCGDEPSC